MGLSGNNTDRFSGGGMNSFTLTYSSGHLMLRAVRCTCVSEGEASSDEGDVFTGEFRWSMPTPNFQLAAFYDNGKATLNKSPWAGAGVNNRILSGASLGLIWNRPSDYSIRLDYAWKITTSNPATSDTDKNGRLRLQATKYF